MYIKQLQIQEIATTVVGAAVSTFELTVDQCQVRARPDGTFHVQMILNPKEGAALDPAIEATRNMQARMYGLPEDVFTRVVKINGRPFTVSGFNIAAPKNPVNLVCNTTKKGFKCSLQALKNAILSV